MNSKEFSNLHQKEEKPNLAAVILAGGRGTRMGTPNKHKCSFEIDGEPSIYRLLDTLRENEISTNVLVVGALSEQIMNLVGKRYKDVIYAFQSKQKGTGNAAKHGICPLKSAGFEGNIFILAGDAYIEPDSLKRLLEKFRSEGADMALLTKKKSDNPRAGHIIKNEKGNVVASIEFWDIRKALAAKRWKNRLPILF